MLIQAKWYTFAYVILFCKVNALTAHNWQKWKRVFLTCPSHKIYRVEAFGLKSSNYTWKIMIFCEYVKFGAISWKIDFVNNCLIKVLI